MKTITKYDTRIEPKSCPYADGLEILIEDFTYMGNGISIKIEKEFVWDGASVPKIFWLSTMSPFMPQGRMASLIHDALYRNAIRYKVSRKKADLIFKALLLEHGVSRYVANKMYIAVKSFGWIPWKQYRKEENKKWWYIV